MYVTINYEDDVLSECVGMIRLFFDNDYEFEIDSINWRGSKPDSIDLLPMFYQI